MGADGALGEVPKKTSKRVCRGRTGVVKCSLTTVASDPFLLDRIEEGVRFYTSLSVWASRFFLFFVLRQLDAGEPLQEFGTTFVRQTIICCAYKDLGTRAKFPKSMLEARTEFLKHVPPEFSFSPRGTGNGWRYLLLEDLAVQMLTAARNSMSTRLFHLLRPWFRWRRKRAGISGHWGPDFDLLWKFLTAKDVVQKEQAPWLKSICDLFTEHLELLDRGQPSLSKGLPVLKFLLGDMEQDKDAKLFPLLPIFSASCKHMPLNTVTLKAMLAGRCDMSETSSGPLLKDYPWDALFTFRGVLHGRKTFDGRITTNGTDVSVQYMLPEPPVYKKRPRKPEMKMPVGVDLTNSTILAIDPGRNDILHGVFHTVASDLGAPWEGVVLPIHFQPRSANLRPPMIPNRTHTYNRPKH